MLKSSRSLVILSLLAILVWPPAGIAAGAGGPPPISPQAPQAPAASAWYDGQIQYSTITNCASIIFPPEYEEDGAGTYVGFLADPTASQPAPNTTYYMHVVVAGLGNACSGMRFYLDLALPPNTSLAITGTNKVYCFVNNVALTPSGDCPQALPASSYNPGAFQIPSPDSVHAYTWPLPQGDTYEFQIPVKSSAALTNSNMQANVWMLDGNSSPWLRPQQGVYVFNTGSATVNLVYPSPSTISITTSTAHSMVYLYTNNLTGTGDFDLGTNTSYSLIHDPLTITVASSAWLVYDDWGPPPLQPDTLYHWRFHFHDSNNHDSYSADQTFRTLPNGQVTIGQGTASTCNASDFESALPTAKSIIFNCGALPITLTLASGHLINSNLTIDGGNKVTLDAGSADGPHFGLEPGAALTLTNITLINGHNHYPVGEYSCGGAVVVTATSRLTVDEARFFNNRSNIQAGAVCVEPGGLASITDSLFMNNRAGNHGGAIGNYGTVTISGTRFVSNTAPINGGAIDTTGRAVIMGSTFVSNTAGVRGGGVNNYLGLLTLSASSFISNTAGGYGGGLSNDSNGTGVSGTTFADNYAAQNGGALQSSGTLTLTNSTLSANHAQLNGGGLFWITGTTTVLTVTVVVSPVVMLLNDTVVSNTAGTTGGNLFVGGFANTFLKLKNTLVAFGSPSNCDDTVATQGNNLESANTCGFSGSGDLKNTAPTIGPLQNNGGPTLTHLLKAGSPALDAGSNSGCPATDQRGVLRPQDGDGNGSAVCDIGAVEDLPGASLGHLIWLPFVIRQVH